MIWKIPWRRKWHPAPEFLPGKSHRQKDLSEGVETDCTDKGTDRQRGYKQTAPQRLQSMGCNRVGHDLVTKHKSTAEQRGWVTGSSSCLPG